MDHFLNEAWEHRFAIGATAWYIVTAFIVTLPEKGQGYGFYDHMYDFTHQLLNIKIIPGLSDKLPAGTVQLKKDSTLTVVPQGENK